MDKKRKSNIEILRFIACIGIFLEHSSILGAKSIKRGYLFVELFYMITGCFCIAKVFRENMNPADAMKQSVTYTFHKLRQLFPYVVIGVLLSYIWRFIFVPPQSDEAISLLLKAPFEVFCFNITGLSNVYLNAPMWYLSAMMIALPVIMYLAIRFRDIYQYYLSWVIPAITYGFFMIQFKGLNTWGNETLFLTGVFRALAGLSLGGCSYFFAQRLGSRYHTNYGLLGGLAEIATYLVACYFTFVQSVSADTGIVALLFVAFSLSYSGITFTSQFTWPFATFLGLSLFWCFGYAPIHS